MLRLPRIPRGTGYWTIIPVAINPSILWAIRQAQTKIAISGVSHLLIRMIKNFSSPEMQNRQFVFAPKIEYQLVAERSEANLSNLQFPTWCPRQELNLHHLLRREIFYPLNYEDLPVIYLRLTKITIALAAKSRESDQKILRPKVIKRKS